MEETNAPSNILSIPATLSSNSSKRLSNVSTIAFPVSGSVPNSRCAFAISCSANVNLSFNALPYAACNTERSSAPVLTYYKLFLTSLVVSIVFNLAFKLSLSPRAVVTSFSRLLILVA